MRDPTTAAIAAQTAEREQLRAAVDHLKTVLEAALRLEEGAWP